MPYISNDPNAFVAIGMQTAQGTPQAAAAKFRFARYLTGTKADVMMDVQSIREGGDGLDAGFTYKRQHKVDGAIVINGRPEILGMMLSAIPGNASWSGASAVPSIVQHFDTNHASFPWFTVMMQYPGSSLQRMLADAKFTELAIAGKPGEPFAFTFPFTAITDQVVASSYTATNYGEDAFLYQNASYLINGAAASGLTSFDMNIKLAVDELYAQNITPDSIVVLARDSTFQYTRRYENATLWSIINMGGGAQPTTSVATGSFTAWQQVGVSASGWIKIELPLLSYRSHVLPQLDPDGKTIIETVQAVPLKGASPMLTINLGNAHASQYTG